MAYMTNTLIAKPSTSMLSGWLSNITGRFKSVYDQNQQAKGAAATAAPKTPAAAASGISTTRVVIGAAALVGVALVFASRKR